MKKTLVIIFAFLAVVAVLYIFRPGVFAQIFSRRFGLEDFLRISSNWQKKTIDGDVNDANKDLNIDSRDLGIMMTNWGESTGYLKTSGQYIVNSNNEKISLKGVQLDFGSGRGDVAETTTNSATLDLMMDATLTENDFKIIKGMGANATRLSLNTYKDFEIDSNPYVYREENFRRLDKVVEWAKNNGIYLIISMRQSPGGHNSSPHSGNNGKNELWSNAAYQDRIAALWKKIAERYKNETVIAGYDLLNEPLAPDKATFNAVYGKIIGKIREADQNHIIFLEGNSWSRNLTWIGKPADTNIALSVHFYEPGAYAVNGNGTYPSVINGTSFDKEAIRQSISERIAYAQSLNMPVFVGEFGALSSATNYLQYDEDIMDILNSFGVSWMYWNMKNIKGISTTQAIYYVNKSTAEINNILGSSVGSVDELSFLKTENSGYKSALKTLVSQYLSK